MDSVFDYNFFIGPKFSPKLGFFADFLFFYFYFSLSISKNQRVKKVEQSNNIPVNL